MLTPADAPALATGSAVFFPEDRPPDGWGRRGKDSPSEVSQRLSEARACKEQTTPCPASWEAAGCGLFLAVCHRQTWHMAAPQGPTPCASRNGDASGRPARIVGHRSGRWCEVSGCHPTAKVGLGWFGRGGAPFHVDAARSEGDGHRPGRFPKRIARKSRNRRWRVCISAPLSFTGLRVSSTD